MKWDYVGGTILFALIGYLIGSISNAVIVSKFFRNEDIRNKTSGNAGATNILRNYGKKLGIFVFFLDVMKSFLAVLIAWCFREYSGISWLSGIMIQVVGLAAIFGHIWPLYFKFKGGKGAASTVGFILAMQYPLAFIGAIIFFSIIFTTKKVSIGSMLSPLIILILQIILVFIPYMSNVWSVPFMNYYDWWVNSIFLGIISIVVILKHIPNIKRLINGEERSLGEK